MKLDLINVNKSYRTFKEIVHASKDVMLSLGSKDMIWISGPTGSGKTTLINLISGIDTIDSGEIIFNSLYLNHMSDSQQTLFRRYNMGLMFQHFELIASLTGLQNMLLPLRFSNKSYKEMKSRVDELVALFNLGSFVEKHPKYMSGGQRQRIGIARAFVYEPRLIIGDEITSHLDRKTATFIYSLIRGYIEEKGAMGIFVSHDSNLEQFASKCYCVEDGILSLRSEHV
ncbi:ABC transporter ATP-binding protein [Candidatus Borreliella tachyglossi]|uniref:ABC transporter ATP-binding protein n=1 Tax=Candidatus Borreliella tachyglossi TaxID=1964448 RepID=UPI004041999C